MITRKYAQNTSVPSRHTKGEIEKELSRFGASGFVAGWQDGIAAICFIMGGISYRYSIKIADDEKEERRLWRSLLLCIKGKLVAVSDGLKTFEQEFIGSIVMPNGKTADEIILPQIQEARRLGIMPTLLIE